LFCATWVAALAFGARVLLKYETTAGTVGTVSATWPADSIVPAPTDKATLVMLAHPHCPCTKASVAELAEIMAHANGHARAYVLFVKPKGASLDWDDTDLRRDAAAIPGVTVVTDEDGREAKRFGAETSGHTLVFDKSGKLLFSGGITASRGHIGNNPGAEAVVAAANAQKIAQPKTPVFGCPFSERNRTTLEEPCSK
jgi:hypothetical protein